MRKIYNPKALHRFVIQIKEDPIRKWLPFSMGILKQFYDIPDNYPFQKFDFLIAHTDGHMSFWLPSQLFDFTGLSLDQFIQQFPNLQVFYSKQDTSFIILGHDPKDLYHFRDYIRDYVREGFVYYTP